MKKSIVYLLLCIHIFNIFSFYSVNKVFAYFELTSGFLIGNIDSPSYQKNPGDTFSIDFKSSNNLGETIKSPFFNLNFSNNGGFVYQGIDQRTRVGGIVITNPIPSSAYNQNDGFSYEITTGEVVDGTAIEVIRSSNNQNGFLIQSNISTYQNELNAWLEARKVSDNSLVTGTSITPRTIYVNVKPHITDYYFEKADGSQTTNQIQGSDAESINLVLKVKDYNGCTNISGGTISANLSQLGLSSNEILGYVSCEADSKTGIFKKTGITTSSSIGTYNFSYNAFIATDSDGNQNNPTDANTTFDDEDKKTDLALTIVAANAPSVSLVSIEHNPFGGPEKQTSNLIFSGSQAGSGKVSLGSDGSCNGGTILMDWTDYLTANDPINYIINSGALSEGVNSITACIKNDGGNIGSINISLVKDTISPTTSFLVISPVNVIENNSSVKFSCNENGSYKVELGGNGTPGSGTGVLDWTLAGATVEYTTAISNGLLSLGNNTIYGYCKDNASNVSYQTGTVTKVPPTPSMVGTNIQFSDSDFDNDGLDGRDVVTSWTLTQEIIDATNFESYRIYLLPSNIDFNATNQAYVKLISNKNTISWTGEDTLKKDSLNQDLTSGGSYKICIAIMGTSGQLGTESCSSIATLTADTVQNAQILSAKFTNNTTLELTTDATLDSDLGTHSGALISYVYNGSTVNPTAVASIVGTKINLTIPSLGSLSATGGTIIMLTGAVHSAGGGYNNYFTSGSLIINDGQAPTVTGFQNNTISLYNGFFTGSINVDYTFAEEMKTSGYTKITFDRTAGNTSVQKVYYITDTSKLTSGSKTIDIDLSSIGLVSGTTYDMKLIGQDLSGNSVTSSAIVVKFDAIGPTAPTLVDQVNTSSQTPTLSWNTSTDDSGNGSGVKEYTIKVYANSDCSGVAMQTLTSAIASKQTNSLSTGTYSWNVLATDNILNVGTVSACDSFMVDTSIPTISNLKITDTVNNNSTSYTKSGNTVEITADLSNTDISKITADLSALTGNSSHTGVICGTPESGISCSYTSGKVTYGFIVGFAGAVLELVRQIKLMVSNLSEINTAEQFVSITVDNTLPTVGTISSPMAQTYGGNSLNIAWSGISDTNLDYLKFEYSLNGGTDYTLIATGSNTSPYVWDITSLSSGTDYKIRITARDRSGNERVTESSVFSLDKSDPVITAGVFVAPISSEYIRGSGNYTILWNTGNITDNQPLPANPLTLEYSTNNGTNWTLISDSVANTGSFVWNIGAINATQAKLRMKATDDVGNESNLVESSVFSVDSSVPGFSIELGTPPNGAHVNALGFDIVGTATDNIGIDSVYYSFKKNADNSYWNGSSYTGTQTWNLLSGSLNTVSYNINALIQPSIEQGAVYDLVVKITDRAGNEYTTNARQYTGDIADPVLTVMNGSGSYFSGSLNISGTSSDVGAGIDSVKISIKKGSDYWNGASWVGGEQLLATSTSNAYADWNYIFNTPGSDTNGQSYEIIMYAYDKSYKENNTVSETIGVTLDRTGPFIENDVFTFTPSGFSAGGENFDITWNPAKITSSGASFSHVKLEYNQNGAFTTITGSTSNDGIHNFNLPSINDGITIVISAYDAIGNISNSVASQTISIDATPPEIQSVETMDMSADGQIDALKVTMNEAINDSTIVLGDLTVSSVGIPTSWETGNSANDAVFILKFSNTGTTATTPTLSYTKGSLTDSAGKFLETVSNFASIDRAVPRVLGAEIFANTSGIFDTIEVTYSENLFPSTDTTAFTLNNGLSISSVSTSGTKATLNLVLGTVQTDSTGYTLDFTANSNWKDTSDNQAGSIGTAINLVDKAVPVLLSSLIKDSNGDYIADTVELSFSESLTGTLSGFSTDTGTLSNPSFASDTILFDISGISGTDPTVNFSYVAGDISDSAGNALAGIAEILLDEQISPKFLSSQTRDADGDGKIDGVVLDFSESLSGSFSDFSASVNGYTLPLNPYSLSGTMQVIASVQEKSTYDTSAVPEVTIASNTSLKDANNNSVISSQVQTSTDGVGPVIIGARYEPSTHKVFMNFSENIDNADFLTGSFILQNAGTYSIDAVNIGEKSITLSGENIDYSLSTVSFLGNSVRDTVGNKQTGTHHISITAPIIINEIMVSDNPDNNYIELHNLSNGSISLSGWTIAGITIPNNTISANGYYLISKSDQATSSINIAPDLVANINLSGNEAVLNNGSIDIDTASLTTGLGNSVIPASIERKSPVGNGLLSASWYRSLTSVGFDTSVPLGTPGSANVFDTTAPTVNGNLLNNALLPIGTHDFTYTYSDNITVSTGSIQFGLEKWNGTVFQTNTEYTTGTINENTAHFGISGLAYGRYKTSFSVSDTAGNIASVSREFYVDAFSFQISTGSVDLGVVPPDELRLADTYVVVEVTTIGAGFRLNHSYIGSDFGDWNGTKGYGACEGTACVTPENYQAKTIVTQASEPQSSGTLKTYTYRVRYASMIDSLQAAGIYSVNNSYTVSIDY